MRKVWDSVYSPAGNYKIQAAKILEKATEISQAVTKCRITRPEAQMLYQSVYRPAVEYTLSQTFLTSTQYQKIQQKTMPRIFAKCGFNRNTSRKVLFGPQHLGGGGFIPLQAVAGAGYVQHFLKQWRSPAEEIGKVLRIFTAWSQYHSGMPYSILAQPTGTPQYIDGRFIKHLCRY